MEMFNIASFRTFPTPSLRPYWLDPTPTLHFLYKDGKKNVTPAESVSLFHEFKNKYSNFTFIYTDGSQKDGKTGAGLTSFDFNKSNRLHDLHSIFTAELQGILSAIHHIIKENMDRGMICSDSSSSLLAIASIQNSAHPLVCKIKNLLRRINSTKQVEFLWIPGHCGIRGNEAADQLAKHSLTLPPRNHLGIYPAPYKTYLIIFMLDIKNFYKKIGTCFNIFIFTQSNQHLNNFKRETKTRVKKK